MKLNVGVTDYEWYERLSAQSEIDEVNFWSPGGKPFKALRPGELFLFKLKAEHGHMIVGGGLFAHDTQLPLSLAWLAFGEKNGVATFAEMATRIRRYQSAETRQQRDPVIGCRLLQRPFFFGRDKWFRVPESFPVNAVSGKTYGLETSEGAYLLRAIEERRDVSWNASDSMTPQNAVYEGQQLYEGRRTGAPRIAYPRLGQGSFRIAVLDKFERRCAITGERTLPILDAAHIKPWEHGGDHQPGNGIPLRTDVHRLFDLGYVTVNHEHKFEVSSRLREDYENGKIYYELHGQPIRRPTDASFLPSRGALEWHHEHRWSNPGRLIG